MRRTPVRVDRNAVHSPQPEDLDQLCQPATPRNIGLKDMHAALLCNNTQHTVRFIYSIDSRSLLSQACLGKNDPIVSTKKQQTVANADTAAFGFAHP